MKIIATKKIATMIGAAVLTLSAVQLASAGQRDLRNTDRTQMQDRQYRDSNAYFAPGARGYRGDDYGYGYSNRDYNRLESLREGGAVSAPAGR